MSEGLQYQRAGDLDRAEQCYRSVLAHAPKEPYALHLLGVICHQRGDNEAAVELIRRSLSVMPNFADAHSNLGAALYALERKGEAAIHFARAAELNPALAEAHSNVAAILEEEGRIEEALERYKAAHAASSQTPKFIKRLADLYLRNEQWAEAVEWFGRFLALNETDFEANNNIGYACERMNRLEDAEKFYRRAVALRPDSPEVNSNLANVLCGLGRVDEADPFYEKALNIDASDRQGMAKLAAIYHNRREYERSVPIYEALLAETPENPKIWCDYGLALQMSGRPHDGEKALLEALRLDPSFAEAWQNLGMGRLVNGRSEQAVEALKRAIECAPTRFQPYLNLCLSLLYARRYEEAFLYASMGVAMPGYEASKFTNPYKVFRSLCGFDSLDGLGDPWQNVRLMGVNDFGALFLELLSIAESDQQIAELVNLHRKWHESVLRRGILRPLPPLPSPRRDGKLRIGIISSDLRSHSVARFVEPVLKHYDRDRFEFYCYSPFESAGDKVQERIKGLVTQFRFMSNVPDREFAETIRADGIDILFELNGFTRDHRLRVLGYRAAPVQIYWLGYPFTTGVEEMDYIMLDDKMKPVNDDWLVEKPLILPDTWCCFEPYDGEPISEQLPVERNGAITFGTMNNPYKISREVVEVWAHVMQRVPDSRFLMVRPECGALILCNNLVKEFGRHGIGAERLFFVDNRATGISHFSYYDEMDITLDTFPLTGGTTTVDALCMGVPVISLIGRSLHQRLSNSVLHNVGLGDLCVETVEDYVSRAVELAENTDALRLIRHNLRPMLADSPLCRVETFTRNFEAALEQVAERHGLC